MSTLINPQSLGDIINQGEHIETKRTVEVLTKAEIYARAERQMRRGKRLVFGGFIVAIVGIVAYCAICFTAAANQELGQALLDSPGWMAGPALGIIGLGTLLWLVGSFSYLKGAMDSDPDGETPDLHF